VERHSVSGVLFDLEHRQRQYSARVEMGDSSSDPKLEIPPSTATVNVYIIDNGVRLGGLSGLSMMDPVLPGFEKGGEVPSYAFLIHHKRSNVRLLFDLSLRADWETAFPPAFVKAVPKMGLYAEAGKDIAELLASSMDLADINVIVLSHHHFDHTGDIGKFPSSTDLLVGPGYRKTFLPGWPENRKQVETTSDLYQGRQVTEVDFTSGNPKVSSVGGFHAHDYFTDGSLYLLSTPGHTIGHLSALARTTSRGGESTFIFMGGDIAHSHAVFRPSSKHPLPASIPSPICRPFSSTTCFSKLIAKMHRLYSESEGETLARTRPFSHVAGPEHDLAKSQHSADKLASFDGEKFILTILTHDSSLLDVVDFFPRKANEWKEKGWKKEGHWRWLAPCLKAFESSKL
jgi:glyoxylase-like metal-dependent hydrolase (beta-lactamase superfamily II)